MAYPQPEDIVMPGEERSNEMDYKFVVIEHYRDGGTWKHFYRTEEEARWGIEDMQEAHRARTYELIEAS